MDADVAQMPSVSARGVPRKRRRRAPSVARIDRRTRTARRVAALVSSFTEFFGGEAALTPLMRANIMRAAELTALAEDARAVALRSGAALFDMTALARIEGAADRAVRRLNLPAATVEHVPFRERLARELADGECCEPSADAICDAPGTETAAGTAERTDEAATSLCEASPWRP